MSLGLIVGNGAYAAELMERLRQSREIVVVSLFPQELSSFHLGVSFYMKPVEFDLVIDHLMKMGVSKAVFGGDAGLFNTGGGTADVLLAGLSSPFIREYIEKNGGNLGAVSLLQFIRDKLRAAGITPVLASDILPDLRPDCGLIVQGKPIANLDLLVEALRRQAATLVGDQPGVLVRQALAFDGTTMIDAERESTDALLRKIATKPKAPGVVRSLVKLCPPSVNPTMDAPVIGPDTIHHSATANVDLILVDCNYGILAKRQQTISLAKQKQITIFGVNGEVLKD